MDVFTQSNWSTAVHEAGHAVLACVFGFPLQSVTIEQNEAAEEAGHAISGDPLGAMAAWEDRGHFRAITTAITGYVLINMAGAEAEIELLGSCAGGDGHDRQSIETAAASADSGITAEQWQRREPRLRRACRYMMRRHRSAILAVATALLQERTLTRADVMEVGELSEPRSVCMWWHDA